MPYSGGVESILFESGDAKILGVLYPAVGDGPRPTAILLHGMPGSEKNWDIAYQLREIGWHSLLISFRGSWGSTGGYEMLTQPDDVIAAIDYLLCTSAGWQVDPEHIAVIGYSFGSRAAIVAAHRERRIGALVTISGIADFDEVIPDLNFFSAAAPFLQESTVMSLQRQWMSLGATENPITIVGQLNQPILIIQGTEDEVVPPYMAGALHDATGQRAALVEVKGADHTFTQHRAELVLTVTDWLELWTGQRDY